MAEEKNLQLSSYGTLPPKFPLGLFPAPLQPYLELIRLEKVYFVNILHIMEQLSFLIQPTGTILMFWPFGGCHP